jgi:hypothetical protein
MQVYANLELIALSVFLLHYVHPIELFLRLEIMLLQPGDFSHVADDEVLKNVISEEADRGSFTAVFINGINMDHIKYLRNQSKEWTQQLA